MASNIPNLSKGPIEILASNSEGDVRQYLERIKKTVGLVETTNKYVKRYNQAKALLDEQKRPGVLFSLGLDGIKAGLKPLMGSVSIHPYWKFHEVHFKILKECVDAHTSLKKAGRQFDEARNIVKRIQAKSAEELDKYSLKSSAYKLFIDSFTPVFLMAWLLRGSISADVQAMKIRQQTIDGWFRISGEVKKVHEAAAQPIDDMIVMIAGLCQDRSAVEFLVEANKKIIDDVKRKNRYGQVAGAHKEMDQMFDLTDSNQSDPIELIYEVDSAISATDKLLSAWIDKISKFENDLYKMNVFEAVNRLSR